MPMLTAEHLRHEPEAPLAGACGDDMLFMQIDSEKCTGCQVCVTHCPTSSIYGAMGLPHRIEFAQSCISCGMCLVHCPERAIHETWSWLAEVEARLLDRSVKCVAMPAPSARHALAEAFGLQPGDQAATGKMLTALRILGFEHCWDVEFGADVAICEEGSEFLRRLDGGATLPQFSSCCPAWQKYCETFYPDLLPNLSACKSPVAINGRLAKTYGARRMNYDPAAVYTVAIMPCLAKMQESLRPELAFGGIADIDATLTTRELVHLIRKRGIDFASLPESARDGIMGESSGGGALFGVCGGPLESLLRFLWRELEGAGEPWDFELLHGTADFKEFRVMIGGRDLRFAAVNGARLLPPLLAEVRRGESPYHFIEVMACPGGCAGGGGQPFAGEANKQRETRP